MVSDAGGDMLWSDVISVGIAGSKVIGETVGFQVAGDKDIGMAGTEVSGDADVPARVDDSGVSIEMTAKALLALISVLKSAKMRNMVLVFHVT